MPRLRLAQVASLPLLPVAYAWWWTSCRLALPRNGPSGHGGPRPIERHRDADYAALVRRGLPAIVTDEVTHWPALERFTPDFLASHYGDNEVDVLQSTADDRDFARANARGSTVHTTLRDVVDHVFAQPPGPVRYYLWGAGPDAWRMIAEHRADFGFPGAIDGRPLDSHISGLWVGQRGNITSLHFDFGHNFLAQFRGRKRIVAFDPRQTRRLYPVSPFSSGPVASRLPPDCITADRSRFPAFDAADRYEAVLEPGQLLYLPPFWWHEVVSLDDNLSLPFRYVLRPREMARPWVFPMAYDVLWWPVMHAMGVRRAEPGP